MSMKPKHTPGPWVADGNGFERSFNISNCDGSICDVSVTRADANLMAAAPEMLEALEQIINSLDTYSSEYNLKVSIRNFAERAIAKATGGAQ